MIAALDQLLDDDVPSTRPLPELDRIGMRRLHEHAVLIARQWSEFFPDVVRPSWCAFDHRDEPRPGTLAALMQAHANRAAS